MHTEETQECHTPIPTGSGTYGLGRRRSLCSHWFNPYRWHLTNQFNWHDKAFLFVQYHWREAKKRNQPYKFKWNEMDKEIRGSYYFNWPIYFP